MTDGGLLVAQVLKQQGVKALFTLSGEHILPIYEGCANENIVIIDTRHEAAAAHAADAYARLSRNIGVCAVTSGPGITNALTGIANAFFAQSPVVCLGGAAPLNKAGQGALQEMDQLSLFKPITKWAGVAYETAQIPRLLTHAIRVALTPPLGPVYLELPLDVIFGKAESKIPHYIHTPYKLAPEEKALKSLDQLLQESERPVLLCGSEAYWDHAQTALRQLVEKHDIPAFLNGMARGMLPADHPLFFNLSRKKAFAEADLIMIAGTPLDFRLKHGKAIPDLTKWVMLSNNPTLLGQNRDPEEGIPGNLALIFKALANTTGKNHQNWSQRLREEENSALEKERIKTQTPHLPMSSFAFLKALDDMLDQDDILIADGGEIVTMAAKRINVYEEGHWLDPGPMGCLGVGAPFALAAKYLYPQKNVFILYGDGSFGFNGMEFDTALRFNLPVIAIVANDAQWSQILLPQEQRYGRALASRLLPTRYDEVAKGLGCYGEHVEKPADLKPAIERAKASGKPALINVPIDPLFGRDDYSMKFFPGA
jgi:acetolactate synthase-1/2/3 large subunit